MAKEDSVILSAPLTRLADQYQALGQSECFLALQEQISRVARIERPVMLIGERGTGKELAAARLHYLSGRWSGPYVTLNCAALAPTLIESELFGHEAGAFTGAVGRRKGRFEAAQGGSLFLDEVGNIPLTAQEKLLRVVEYHCLERVGSSRPIEVDARLIAATNEDPRKLAETGRLRRDLLDRLAFEVIVLPPLRARREDIDLLTDHFARVMARELGWSEPPRFSPAARRALNRHEWPGNVRELKNVVERMVARSGGQAIDEIVFDPFASAWMPGAQVTPQFVSDAGARESGETIVESRNDSGFQASPRAPLPETVRRLELACLRQALEAERYNQRNAARRLGISYDQFRGYYRKYKEELLKNEL